MNTKQKRKALIEYCNFDKDNVDLQELYGVKSVYEGRVGPRRDIAILHE